MRGLFLLFGLILVACGGGQVGQPGPESQPTSPAIDTSTEITVVAEDPSPQSSFAYCDNLEWVRAPDEYYRDSPIYVANEQPIEEVVGWAETQPGFAGFWVDRERNGWITLAFNEGGELRQSDLERLFPEAGVVAIDVGWNDAEMARLQDAVTEALLPFGWSFATGRSMTTGFVSVDLGILSAERLAVLEENFANEFICVEGLSPDQVIPDGPQPTGGDGWTLLASQQDAGEPYRTGIAWDESTFDQLWATAGIEEPPPPVDFEENVVIWFGAVFGTSCPGLRLDDVISNQSEFIVHAEIVLPSSVGTVCTSDARPHAFVVTLERDRLPDPPFVIQLSEKDPPSGAPEERTTVLAGLSAPGAVAGPEAVVVGGYEPPRSNVIEHPNFVIEPGFPAEIRIDTHCGIDYLRLNGVTWHAPEHPTIPEPWLAVMEEETLLVEVLLPDDDLTLNATANGYTVSYIGVNREMPGCD